MKSAVLSGNDLVIDEVQNAQAQDLLEKTKDCRKLIFSVSLENGEIVELPTQLSRVLEAVIETAAQGGRTSFSSVPSELTSAAAARLLGLSRPTLMKLIAERQIPSHKVG
ncbi:MAG: helix-turn-helix domain-containing protein, partial [Aurantimicrobium sp.]